MKTAVCLIVKNEVRDLAEWIVHYSLLGFDQIIVYDNESEDGTSELLKELSFILPVEVLHWPYLGTGNRQLLAYNHCLDTYGARYDWIAFFDVDEFLISTTMCDLKKFLEEFADCSGVVLNWLTFGSNSLYAPIDIVMLDYTKRATSKFPPNRNVKSIIRPAKVVRPCNNPHWFPLEGPYVDINHKQVAWSEKQIGIVDIVNIVHGEWRLHHYYTRSRWHWSKRLARGQAGKTRLDWSPFRDHDRNDIVDTTAVIYAQRVKEKIVALGLEGKLEHFYARLAPYAFEETEQLPQKA